MPVDLPDARAGSEGKDTPHKPRLVLTIEADETLHLASGRYRDSRRVAATEFSAALETDRDAYLRRQLARGESGFEQDYSQPEGRRVRVTAGPDVTTGAVVAVIDAIFLECVHRSSISNVAKRLDDRGLDVSSSANFTQTDSRLAEARRWAIGRDLQSNTPVLG